MRRIFVAGVVAFAFGAVGTRAETDTTNFTHPTQLPDSIMVTANRFGETAARSVWPAAAIPLASDQNPASFKQALDGKYGLDIRETSGYGSLATLSNWGTFNRHMLLLYNGRVVKDYSLGGFNLADYSADEFDRIEILKGPQSALYGSDAVGGVINLISPSVLVDRANVMTRVGSFGTRQYRLDASRSFGKIGLGVFGELGQSDNGRANSGARRQITGVRGEYLSGDGKHQITASARYFNDSLGLPGPVPDPNFIPVYGNAESYNLNQRQQDQDYSADFSYHFYDKKVGEGQLDAFWEKKNLDYHELYNYQSYYNTATGGGDSVLNIDSVDVYTRSLYNKRSSGICARFLKEVGPVQWSTGVDWLSGSLHATSADHSLGTNIVGPGAPYGYSYDSYSYWAKEQNQLDFWGASSIAALGGIDVDLSGRIQTIHGRKVQPSYDLGLIVKPIEPLRVKLGYGYAFRLPSIADQFADDVYTHGNADLSPETSRSLILSTELADVSGFWSASVTLFRQSVNSLIQYIYEPTSFLSIPRNVDQFRSRGIDVAFEGKPWRNWTFSLDGVWQKAEQTNGGSGEFVRAFYVPELKWRADVRRDRILGRLSAGVGVTYTSDRYLMLYGGTPKTIGRVFDFDASLTAQVNRWMHLTLAGSDLTNRRRPDQFGYSLADRDFPSPGRRISLLAKFSAL